MSSINDYFRQKLANAKSENLSKGEAYILQVNVNELIEYYHNKDSLPLLEKDENVILDDGFWGSNKKLVLTNQRLLVQKRKGTIISKWKIENEILLEEIEEAYGMIDVFTSLSSLILKLKNKELLLFNFRLIDSQMPSLGGDAGTFLTMKTKEITDKYLTGINHQIQKNYRNILPRQRAVHSRVVISPLVFAKLPFF